MSASRDHGTIVDAFLEWNRILTDKEGQSAWVFGDQSVVKVSISSGPDVAGAYLAYVNPLFAKVFAEGIDARY
jgi:hypothetical protein